MMNPQNKLQKLAAFRRERLMHSHDMASLFFLSNDDQDLLKRIHKNDESALLQFAIKHISLLTRWVIKRSLHIGYEDYLMDLVLPHYVQQIKEFSDKYHDKELPEYWSCEIIRPLEKKSDDLIQAAYEKNIQVWRGLEINEQHVAFLNHLNDFLSSVEEKIVERAKTEVKISL